MDRLLSRLESLLGPGQVLSGPAVRERATSWFDPSPMGGEAIVRPADTQQVAAVLRLCHEAGQPVVVHGGRTGGAQGQHVRDGELVLSTERMNRVLEIDTEDGVAVVEAGCVLERLHGAAQARGLHFPLDLGARGSCTVGGNIATNAGGVTVLRYGMMREVTLGLEAVLADGTVLSSLNRLVKNNSGYDLKQLFIGSEGTLGVVTRAVVRLIDDPGTAATAMVATASFAEVAALLTRLRRALGPALHSFEYMDRAYYAGVTGPGANRAPLDRGQECYVVVEAVARGEGEASARLAEALTDALEEGAIEDAILAQSSREREAIWAVREGFEPLLRDRPCFLYDVSLPIRHMAAYQREVKRAVAERFSGARCYALAHVGDNNLHWFISPREEGEGVHEAVSRCVYAPLPAMHGSVSAEHGIGFEKKAWLGLTRSAEELETMRRLKQALDPKGILAPGRIFDAA